MYTRIVKKQHGIKTYTDRLNLRKKISDIYVCVHIIFLASSLFSPRTVLQS